MRRSTYRGLRTLAVCGLFTFTSAALAATPVFVNELHYDNGGADSNEGIEIAGPVGTDISGWSIVLYNGNGGALYDTWTVPAATTIPANCGAMTDGVYVLNGGQIQNGGNDGFALVDAQGNVIQFLSYEGPLTATNGPAAGMLSTDIGVAEDGGTLATQSLQLTGPASGTGSNYEDFSWSPPATASFGTCNPGQHFPTGTVTDNPPTVSTTAPADGATDVAVSTALTINFSENVTVSPGAVSLVCGGNAVAGSETTSTAAVTFTPTAAMPAGSSCSVTVNANHVADIDLPVDNMASDYTFGFQTAADLAPTVTSTTPADGSSGFPASGNLGVTFSEPVALAAGWYDLTCGSSGNHTATVSGSGASYNLDPGNDFTALENCTFTIHASAVTDLDGGNDPMAANVVVQFAISGGTGDYYAGVDTSSGPALEAWLHTRLTTAPAPYTEIKAYPYSSSSQTDTWDVLSQADEDPSTPGYILDLYKNESYQYLGGGNQLYNREHTWPKSLGFPDSSINSKPNPPYNDLHMLHLADKDYNAQRGNGLLGNCTAPACAPLWTVANDGFGGNNGQHANANWKNGDTMFEVWDHRKGDVARAVMYMAVRYDGGVDAAGICEPDLQLTDNASLVQTFDAQTAPGCSGSANVAYNGLLTDLLQWNQQDPPDTAEQLRNDLVFSYQHNRNPFIDHPEWAECVFKNTSCPVAGDLIFKNGFDPTTP